jgi:calcineurin-like phosphoesterase family protein
MTRIVCISDTHFNHRGLKELPDGDVLIHAGDCTGHGTKAQLKEFLIWFDKWPHKHKILIAGNHDWVFQNEEAFRHGPENSAALVRDMAPSVTYLEDSGTVINGLNFWGSPWTPRFLDWAFNADRGSEVDRLDSLRVLITPMQEIQLVPVNDIRDHWNLIPDNTDVLVTHGPPFGFGDEVEKFHNPEVVEKAGDRDLYEAVLRVRPFLHVNGHLHSGYGQRTLYHDDGQSTVIVNASVLNENYKLVNKPIVIEL